MAITYSCGAVAVIFNPKDNPGLFQKDNNYILKRFELYGKKCVLISEGNKVSLISEPGMKKEEEIFSVILPDGIENKINSVVLKWYNNSLSLCIKTLESYRIDLRSITKCKEIFYSGFT
ncbi:TPA: hypothetical protein DCR49_04175 [Candidatus Delongbacteria bacterium]|nr:hypothetical protein [Candidatus Delongbacteria bacterium]